MNFYKLFCLRLLSGMTWFFVIFSGINETKKDSRPDPREAGTPMNADTILSIHATLSRHINMSSPHHLFVSVFIILLYPR